MARSQQPLGPYQKLGRPILHTDGQWVGPGHCSVIQTKEDPSQWVMIYHSWRQNQVCGGFKRVMVVDYVDWTQDGWPVMRGVTGKG